MLVLAAVAGMATTAQAASYKLYVGGVQLTDENASSMTGGNIKLAAGGYVKYDLSANTLYLKNVTIDASSRSLENDWKALTIVIEGKCSFTCSKSNTAAVRTNYNTTLRVSSGASLTVNNSNNDASFWVGGGSTLTVEGPGVLKVESYKGNGFAGDNATAKLAFKNECNVYVNTKKSCIYRFESLTFTSGIVRLFAPNNGSGEPQLHTVKAFSNASSYIKLPSDATYIQADGTIKTSSGNIWEKNLVLANTTVFTIKATPETDLSVVTYASDYVSGTNRATSASVDYYKSGTTAIVRASYISNNDVDYTFAGWYENNSNVSNSMSYSFTVNKDRNLIAKATKTSYTVNVAASPAFGGTVSGGGTFVSGSYVTVTATPKSGYTFKGWYSGSTQLSTATSYTHRVVGNVTLTAKFYCDYGFKVAGISVTTDNYNGITSSDITHGTVSYNPETKTLLLNQTTITRSGSGNYAIQNLTCYGLIIDCQNVDLTTTGASTVHLAQYTTIKCNNQRTNIDADLRKAFYG